MSEQDEFSLEDEIAKIEKGRPDEFIKRFTGKQLALLHQASLYEDMGYDKAVMTALQLYVAVIKEVSERDAKIIAVYPNRTRTELFIVGRLKREPRIKVPSSTSNKPNLLTRIFGKNNK